MMVIMMMMIKLSETDMIRVRYMPSTLLIILQDSEYYKKAADILP